MHGTMKADLEDLQDTLNLGAHKGDAGSNLAYFSTIPVTSGTGKKINNVVLLLRYTKFWLLL